MRTSLAVAAFFVLAAPAAASADEDSEFRAASADGLHVFFTTQEQMVAEDTDNATDIFERTGGATTLISTGPAGGNGNGQTAFFEDTSDDGSIVMFRTFEQLVAGDTDDAVDLYERSGSTTTLLSTGPAGGNGDFDVSFSGASSDGTRAYFTTLEALTAGDLDASGDVYRRSGSTTTLISAGAINGNGAFNAFFRGASDDGTRAFFTTSEPLVSSDTDTSTDVYQRSGSTTTLMSAGAINGNGAFSASFQGVSADGSRVLFSSSEQLVSADTDSRIDIYERSGGVTTLISAGAINGNGSFDVTFRGASADATRVFFVTSEPLVAADTDSQVDIYERSAGTTSRVSGEASGDNGAFDAAFRGASDDGTVVFFTTAEPIRTGDADSAIDIYARFNDGSVDGLTAEHSFGDGPFDVTFGGNTPDGGEVFYTTQEAIPGSGDEDESTDVYQFDFDFNSNFRVSGPAFNFDGGEGGFPARFGGASVDGSRVFFTTFERLASQDVDGAKDVYGTFVGSSLFSREAKPPETTIGGGVAQNGFTNDETPVFSFTSSEPGSTFQCRLTTSSFGACTPPGVFGPLPDGSTTIEVKATDAAGNVDPTPATRTFTVDTIAPDASIDAGPNGPTRDPTPTFGFSADETSVFGCRVDSDSYSPCSGPGDTHTPSALSEGSHTFHVRARDLAGNTSFASTAFKVDTTAPNTVIDDVVVTRSKRQAQVFFRGTDAGSSPSSLTFKCRLDSAALAQPCTSPKFFKSLSLGAHTVSVRAFDAAGNPDPTPASKSFTL